MDTGYDGVGNDYPDLHLTLPYKARRHHPLTEEQKGFNRQVASARIVGEHTLAQMNPFQVLAQVFRHSLAMHPRVGAGVVNRRMALQPLKASAVSM